MSLCHRSWKKCCFLPRTRQNRTVEQIVDVSPDSGGNFRVGVIRHAFHLAQILRAHATPFPSVLFFRAVRRTLKPVTPLEPLVAPRTVLLTSIPRPMHPISSELVSAGNAAAYCCVLGPPVPKCKGRLHNAHTRSMLPTTLW